MLEKDWFIFFLLAPISGVLGTKHVDVQKVYMKKRHKEIETCELMYFRDNNI